MPLCVAQCLVDALNSGVMSVQLAAVQALRLLVDDWGFYIDDFQAFIGPTLEALLRVLRAADEFETQVQVTIAERRCACCPGCEELGHLVPCVGV